MKQTDESVPLKSGLRLKAALKRFGIKQKTIAKQLNYQENSISMICRGDRNLSPANAEKICEVIPGLRVEYLLCMDDYMTENEYFEALKEIEAFNEGFNEPDIVRLLLKKYGYTFDMDPTEEGTDCYICRNGMPIARCSMNEADRFEQDICDFALLWAQRLIERSEKLG